MLAPTCASEIVPMYGVQSNIYQMTPLKQKINSFPKAPGVYQFLDNTGAILYVGKAKNLKSRVKSYFLSEIGRGPAIDIMVSQATDAKYIQAESEIEAVLLEAELINKLKPKYNSRQKDDKSFLVIRITKKISNSGAPLFSKKEREGLLENFPCVEVVRARNVDFSDKTADYFGPYPSGELLKKSLRYLRKIFPYRDCSKTKWNTYARKKRPCIYGDIRICPAPCAGYIGEKEYNKNITYLKNFLHGRKKVAIEKLTKEMKLKSRAKRFEEASLIRDKLAALDHIKDVALGLRDDVFEGGTILFKRIECFDIANIGSDYAVGSMVVFTNGKPDKSEYRHFKIKNQKSHSSLSLRAHPSESKTKIKIMKASIVRQESDLSRLEEVLERRFMNDWPIPDLVVVDGGEQQLAIAKRVIKEYDIDRPVISISKGAKRDKNEFHFGDSNIAKYFGSNQKISNVVIAARDEAHRFAINYYRKLHRKGMMK